MLLGENGGLALRPGHLTQALKKIGIHFVVLLALLLESGYFCLQKYNFGYADSISTAPLLNRKSKNL
jgi:hypothetical protein